MYFLKSPILRWQFLTVRFITVALHMTVFCSVCIATAASVQPPGETTPDIIEIGIGDNANITCHIVGGANSSSIWFSEENTKKRIEQPNNGLHILDAQTAVLTIRNATEHKGRYQCMSGENAIGITKVYVGTPPIDVNDFLCKGYDYYYMTCSFTKPPNMIYTNYSLQFGKDNSYYGYNCELKTSNYTYCNISYLTEPVYVPSQVYYYFNLTGTNALGSKSQIFAINNHRSVIPAKLNIEVRQTTSDSVVLFWKIIKYGHYKDEGLDYKIRLKPEGFNWYDATNFEQCSKSNCTITINNLQYPYREYMINVRVKVRTAKNVDYMWSEPFIGRFMTKPRRPDNPPATAVGSFYIDPTETYVRLYWKQLLEYEENGPKFTYAINKTDMQGNVIKIKFTNETSITFGWNRKEKCYYEIRAHNIMGSSENSTVIRVNPILVDAYSPQTIATVYHNRTYTLSWKPPVNKNLLVNYTVFWCLSKMESPNQCRGTIHFNYLDKYMTNFTTDPQDHTLNLAVSANYISHITGMHWAMCSADVSSDLMKLEPEASAESASKIRVHWSSERVCTSILKGYNLTYCEESGNVSTKKNISNCTTIVLLRTQKDYKDYIISGLKPFTKYRIEIFMYSATKVGPISDSIYVNTSEAAPSPPRNLNVNVSSISSNSATISWQPPMDVNGVLKYYTIWKINTLTKEHKDGQKLYMNETRNNETLEYTLTSLNSFSDYEVYVTAHTIESSKRSNSIYFKTLVGMPTTPRNVSVIEEGNYGLLKWSDPEMPSGRVEFYVVSLVTKRKQPNSEDDIKEIVALVNGHSCKFRFPECIDSSVSFYLKVRAVNVAEKHEIDLSTFSNTKSNQNRHRRHSHPEISTKVVGTNFANAQNETKLSTQNPIKFKKRNNVLVESGFQCLDHDQVDKKYLSFIRRTNDDDIDGDSDEILFIPSLWENSLMYKCSDFPLDNVLATAVVIILCFGLFSVVSFWLRKKYNKMKNINAILPEELIDHKPSYQLGYNNSDKEPSDISRSNDCLVYEKKNNGILSSLSNKSITAFNSLTEHNAQKSNEQQLEQSASNSCNDEQISQSTDTVELNDISSASSSSSISTNRSTLAGTFESKKGEVDYIKSDAAMLSHSTSDVSIFHKTTPTTSNYVQPHEVISMAPQAAFNGYTTLDAMGKTNLATGSVPFAQPPSSTSKFVGDASSNCKDTDIENTSHWSPPVQSNHNNNNTLIGGYVTQRQLAEFGQLLH